MKRFNPLAAGKTRGFTLIEALLAVTLVAVISLSAVSVFSLGLQIWKRTRQMNRLERKAVLALEKMGADLRSAVRFTQVQDTFSIQSKTKIEFKGTPVQIMIPAVLLPQSPSDLGGYARKTYRWDSAKRELCRSTEKASDLYRKSVPSCDVIAGNVTKFRIHYRLSSGFSGSYSWYDNWDGTGGLPLGIEIEMEVSPETGTEKKIFKRLIVIPSAN